MADIDSNLPVNETSAGTAGAAVPTIVDQVGGKDGSGNLQALVIDGGGGLSVITPDISGSGSLTTLNSTVVVNTSGMQTINFSVTGTWVGTITVQASVDSGATYISFVATGTGQGVFAATTVNDQIKCSCSGFTNIRLIMSAYTSGTAVINWAAGDGPGAIQVWNTNAASLITRARAFDGSGNSITSTSNALDVNLKTSSITLPISGSISTVTSGTVSVIQVTNPWVVSGTVTTTQGTSPWVTSGTTSVIQNTSPWINNVTQFGSVNISTGTGASGTGIPRVTVSNDSKVLLWDSTNTATVKAASTAAAAADTALVVSLSPNSPADLLLANTAVAPTTVSVGTTATLILASDTTRRLSYINNGGSKQVYYGFTNAVTTSNGIPLISGDTYIEDRYNGDIYGIVSSGTVVVRVQAAKK